MRRYALPRLIFGLAGFGLVLGALGGCDGAPKGAEGVSPELAESLAVAAGATAADTANDPIRKKSAFLRMDRWPRSNRAGVTEAAADLTERIEFDKTTDCPVSGTGRLRGSGTLTTTESGDTRSISGEIQAETT